jgi:hypothetical protein
MSHDFTETDTQINKLLRRDQNLKYTNTILTLFTLLRQANLADSLQADEWQEPHDAVSSAGRYYHCIRGAIHAIAGEAIVENEAETGEIDMSLAYRIQE